MRESGTPLQVSGPAAGLAVITGGLIEQFGVDWFGSAAVAIGVAELTLPTLGLRLVHD